VCVGRVCQVFKLFSCSADPAACRAHLGQGRSRPPAPKARGRGRLPGRAAELSAGVQAGVWCTQEVRPPRVRRWELLRLLRTLAPPGGARLARSRQAVLHESGSCLAAGRGGRPAQRSLHNAGLEGEGAFATGLARTALSPRQAAQALPPRVGSLGFCARAAVPSASRRARVVQLRKRGRAAEQRRAPRDVCLEAT
jgi:hypothetical protein